MCVCVCVCVCVSVCVLLYCVVCSDALPQSSISCVWRISALPLSSVLWHSLLTCSASFGQI